MRSVKSQRALRLGPQTRNKAACVSRKLSRAGAVDIVLEQVRALARRPVPGLRYASPGMTKGRGAASAPAPPSTTLLPLWEKVAERSEVG